jgi:hypothetical protein
MQHFFGKAFQVIIILVFVTFAISTTAHASDFDNLISERTNSLYQSIDFGFEEKPAFNIFKRAMIGFYLLKQQNTLSGKDIISIIDFTKSANDKRLWIIDLKSKKLLYYSLVAHGRNTGEVYAEKFSNIPHSHQSSLGFYVTANTYIGKHGLSLRLTGLEHNINDKAESRAIVIHGADYVSDSFIKKVGRLGRSQGCPAIPYAIHESVIKDIEGGTCLFIFYPDATYDQRTRLQDVAKAMEYLTTHDGVLADGANTSEALN